MTVKYGPVIQATLTGIEHAGSGIPPELEEPAMLWVQKYAEEHLYFTGGDVLKAWRDVGDAEALRYWRNQWGAIIMKAKCAGWIRKVGRIRPTTVQSHTQTLVKWQSLVYQGDEQPEPQAFEYLIELRKQFHLREIDFMDALWKAYQYGTEM